MRDPTHQQAVEAQSRTSWKKGVALAVSVLLLAVPTTSRADLLTFTPDVNGPVIQSFFGTLTYDSGTGALQSQLVPLSIASPLITGGFATFTGATDVTTIDLLVDTNGNFVGSGTPGYLVQGNVDLDGDAIDDLLDTSPLISGTIIAFGAEAAGPPTRVFNGLVTITGGQLTMPVSLSGGGSLNFGLQVGQTVGFFLFAEDVTVGELGNFTANFASESVKSEFVTIVPEPNAVTTWLIAALGLLAGSLAHRWRRRGAFWAASKV